MKTSRLALATAILVIAAGCVRTNEPAPVVTTPRYPDFMFPASPAALGNETLLALQQRGWQFLQAGDLGQARRAFSAALAESSRFYPADAGLAYASLADHDVADAIARFDRVLRRAAGYVPAMVGKADALAEAGRLDDATRLLTEVLAVDPSLAEVRRRIDVLAFRGQQEALKAARQAADAGRFDEAAAMYERAITTSPDSAWLYRELAAVERKAGRSDASLAHLRKAVSVDPSEARGFVQLGELLEERGDFAGAVNAYAKAEALEPGDEARARVQAARSRADLAGLPDEYRAIGSAAQTTRGDLAALIGVRLGALLKVAAGSEGGVVTDARSHWAAPWIMAVVRAGVMEPYPNHAFAPRSVVRRLDLAQAASRVLGLIAARRPAQARAWQAARPRIVDLPTGHLGYPAVAMVVGADVMPLYDGAAFRPTQVVAGGDAIAVVTRLEVLAR
jgi:tetratricopeptide (TPR) repeat protein